MQILALLLPSVEFHLLGHIRLGLVRVYYAVDNRKKQPFKALFSPHAPIAQVDQKKRMEKTSQAINLTEFSGSGNVFHTTLNLKDIQMCQNML